MRRGNAAGMFSLIRDNPGITRREIERATGLSWGAVSGLCSLLLERGYVTESKDGGHTGAGRVPSRLYADGERHCVLGVDVNGSGLGAAVYSLAGEVLAEYEGSADFGGVDECIGGITGWVSGIISANRGRTFGALGVAMQGEVDPGAGVSRVFPPVEGWRDVPLAGILKEALGLPVYLAHDPDCVLYAYSGSHSLPDALLLRADSGVGMSVMRGGRLYSEPGTLEIGHTCVKPRGPRCRCGKRGCLEMYASERGIAALSGKPYPDVERLAAAGDRGAERLFLSAGKLLAVSAANAATLFGVRDILLYGGLWGAAGGAVLRRFRETLRGISGEYTATVLPPGGAALGAAILALRSELGAEL